MPSLGFADNISCKVFQPASGDLGTNFKKEEDCSCSLGRGCGTKREREKKSDETFNQGLIAPSEDDR